MSRGNRRIRNARRKNKRKTRIVALTLILVIIVLGANIIRLYEKNKMYAAKEENLKKQYEEQVDREGELSALEEFTKTMDYIEQVAREKLGLVFPNEIIFKSDN